MSATCPFCKSDVPDQDNQCRCGAKKSVGIVQKTAGVIALLISMAVAVAVMVLISAIPPIGKVLYSNENAATTSQVLMIAALVAVWVLRDRLRKPKWTAAEGSKEIQP